MYEKPDKFALVNIPAKATGTAAEQGNSTTVITTAKRNIDTSIVIVLALLSIKD